RIVVHLSIHDDAAVAVGRVFIETDVGDDEKIRQLLLEAADRFLNRPAVIPGLAPGVVFLVRQSKEDHRRNREIRHRARLRQSLIGRQAKDAGKRGDFLAQSFSVLDEERRDETIGGKPGLAHQRPRSRTAAPAPQARARKARHVAERIYARGAVAASLSSVRSAAPKRASGAVSMRSTP